MTPREPSLDVLFQVGALRMVTLPDPRDCPKCKKGVAVDLLETRRVRGYVRRRRRCRICKVNWNSYETIINPHDLPQKLQATHYL